jgi:TM2 domain-containing membrane protein YozV
MHCTNCGNEVAAKAVACIKCGVPPRAEKKFCYNCGEKVNPQQAMCLKCGVALKGGGGGASSTGSKTKLVAGLLAIFVGTFGVHKFYHGSWGFGLVFIGFGVLTCGWGWLATWVAGLVEGIMYLAMDEGKYDERYNHEEPHPFKW